MLSNNRYTSTDVLNSVSMVISFGNDLGNRKKRSIYFLSCWLPD